MAAVALALMKAKSVAREIVATMCPPLARGSGLSNLGADWVSRIRLGMLPLLLPRVLGPRGLNRPIHVRIARPWGTVSTAVHTMTEVMLIEELFAWGEYSADLGNPETIVDAGSNIGLAAIDFTLRCPNATILAIEPDPAAYAKLLRNTRRHTNIRPINVALAAQGGTRQFWTGTDSWVSGFERSHAGQRPIEVTAARLDDVLVASGLQHVDVLKLDVEGAEAEALAGFSGLGQLALVIGEVHGPQGDLASDEVLKTLSVLFELEITSASPANRTFVARRRHS